MERSVVFLVFIALATSASAFNHLTPWDKEVIYNWQALVKAGTDLPTPHGSQFILTGKLHLQSSNNATHIQIKDLTYKLYNGILDHVHEHEAHSVPVHIQDLQQVFKVVYDTNGLAIGIVTDVHEKEFSRNMKKALATILQMDDSVLKQVDHHHHYSYVLKEQSIYGVFDVDYTVRRQKDGGVIVQKLHHMENERHLYQNMISNNEADHCDESCENPLTHVSRRDYYITTQDGHHVVKNIHTVGMLTYQPFRGHSEHQFVVVNQSLELSQMVSITHKLQIPTEHFEDHLTYHFFVDAEDGSIHDITNGRHIVNHEKLISKLQEMLQDVHQYLHEDHIHTHEPETKRGQMVNRAQRLLQMLTLAKLQELHQKLSGDSLTVFHHILPLVGTKASVLFIKQLVVNKVVNDDIASEMLQHLSAHVVEPTVELLSQLEDFIHLDNVHWNVRRSAILSFATLIHKSHVFAERVHQNQEFDHHVPHTDAYSHQQPYEKYVVEYINQLRSSQEYKVRMTYIFGLFNMRLHSIVQHMLPGVRGDWFGDYHSRILCLWAVGSAAEHAKDSNNLIEAIWPIFVDDGEITEMRILAFYFLTHHGKLSQSRLMNMYEFLLREKNKEVYRFAYTNLQEIANTNDECLREFRRRVRQVIQLLPPPTHGKSFVKIHDYRDVIYGFSSGLSEYFVNGNHALMHGFLMTSQQFNIVHEDYFVYMKVHGLQTHGDPSNMLIDILRRKTKSLTTNKEVHIECAIHRQGHVINTFFFDQHNLHELNSILDFFTKESHSLSKNLLHVTYNELHQAVIPTDLGIPAVWEFLKPVVHHNNVTITKETVNKVVNVRVDSRYVNWVHCRHGLTFYNPVADVWQGINRYHAYDAVVPLHFDVSLNMQQQSLQLSWKKHNNHQQNVAGLRSHVKQMVFVKDDYQRNILGTSSPNCKEFVIVSHGKQFRNDYTITQNDDLSTGHQWYVGVYDSSRHVSNGTFYHLLHRFSWSHPRHTESPLSHFLKTCANFHQHFHLFPSPGIYGFVARIEPSHQHAVSNVDLSVRLHSEPVSDDSYHYSPKTKWSTRITYSVKNQEASLKTWDVNTILDVNPGHTVNNLKMHITRIVPGQRDYKICVDGVKKWTQKGVEGHLNVGMSQTSDGKCVKDDTVVDITMTGQQSEEQLRGRNKYESCEKISPYSVPHTHSLQCLVDHTTARHYIYNVKTLNVPTEFRKAFAHWWDTIKGYHMSYYAYQDEHNENIGDHNFKIDVVYPMQAEIVDVGITTPQHIYRLTGVPTHQWKWYGLSPDSIDYPKWFQFLHSVGFVDHCVVDVHHHHMNQNQVDEQVPQEWTLFVGNMASNPQKAVYVKRVDQDLAVKIVDHGHIVEIVPHGATHQITLDGQVVPVNEYHHQDWVYCHVFTQDSERPVAVMMQNSGLHVEYHHHKVIVVVPKVDQQLHGRCYESH